MDRSLRRFSGVLSGCADNRDGRADDGKQVVSVSRSCVSPVAPYIIYPSCNGYRPGQEACAMADGRQAKELTNNFLYSTSTDCFLRAPPPCSVPVHKKRRRCQQEMWKRYDVRMGRGSTHAAARRPPDWHARSKTEPVGGGV